MAVMNLPEGLIGFIFTLKDLMELKMVTPAFPMCLLSEQEVSAEQQ